MSNPREDYLHAFGFAIQLCLFYKFILFELRLPEYECWRFFLHLDDSLLKNTGRRYLLQQSPILALIFDSLEPHLIESRFQADFCVHRDAIRYHPRHSEDSRGSLVQNPGMYSSYSASEVSSSQGLGRRTGSSHIITTSCSVGKNAIWLLCRRAVNSISFLWESFGYGDCNSIWTGIGTLV